MAAARSNPVSSMVHESDGEDLVRAIKEADAEVAASSSVLQCGGGEYNQVSVQVWGRTGVEGHQTLLAQSDWEEF